MIKAIITKYMTPLCIILSATTNVAEASTNTQDSFFEAVDHHDQAQLTAFLKNYKDFDLNQTDLSGRTALYIAASNDDLQLVHFLLNNGADINHINNFGLTALSAAAISGNMDVFRYLIARGADPSIVNELGGTALTFAQQNQHAQIVDFLIEHNEMQKDDFSDWDALYTAAYSGNLEIFQYLVEEKRANKPQINAASNFLLDALSDKNNNQVNIIKASVVTSESQESLQEKMRFVPKHNKTAKPLASSVLADTTAATEVAVAAELPAEPQADAYTYATETLLATANTVEPLVVASQFWNDYIIGYINYNTRP